MAGSKRISRVVLYARLSVTTEESVSIERQLEASRKLAQARGWEVIGEFVDEGVSATKVKPSERAGWRRLIAAEHKYDAVIVWKVDRLARRVMDFLQADEVLQARGAGLLAVEDSIDMTSAQGRAFATMLAVFAEMEAAAISARVTAARRALLRAGRRPGGKAPFGWMNVPNPDGPGVVLAQDPERIDFVRKVAAQIAAGGTLYGGAKWLTENGAERAPRANRKHDAWHPNIVEDLLRNPVLAGMTRYESGRQTGEPSDPTAVLRDASGLPIVDESVAILTTEEWRQLQAVLDSLKRPGSRPRSAQTPALLASMLSCGTCGSWLHRQTSKNELGYRCVSKTCSRKASIARKSVEQHVEDAFLAKFGDSWGSIQFKSYPSEAMKVGMADVEAAITDIASQLADDDADEKALLQMLHNLKEERERLRREEYSSVDRMALAESLTRPQLNYRERWNRASDDGEKRNLLREKVSRIVVMTGLPRTSGRGINPERVRIDWR